ncbi:MAG: antitoxin family protein [Gemmataceae bacterium]
MSKTIHAVFENGIFRPVEPVDLPEKVEVEFEPRVVLKNNGWPDKYFETTAGAFAKEPFERPEQGALPNRGCW